MDTDPDGTQIFMQLLVLVFLTLVNAFFAGAEMAVVSVNKNRINMLAEEGDKKAILIQSLFTDSTKFLSTIQVAITCAGFFSSASAATGITQALSGWMEKIHIPYADTISFFGVTIILMYFNLVFGELVPKRIALQKSEFFCFLTVRPIYFISKILSPFIALLSITTNGMLRLMGMKTESDEEMVSEEEIKAMLEKGRMDGVIEEHEREMIRSVFSFDDKSAREIMVPRKEVYAINIEESIHDQIIDILKSRHSRIPIYENDIDNIIGVLHINDYIIAMQQNQLEDKDIRSILQKPFFVPDSREADELFREMQKSQKRMAILIDEYGGFSGIITIEDLVEEIVGDINEENDAPNPEFEKIEKNEFLIDGKMLIEDLNDKLNLKIQTENCDTVSGFLIEKLGYIPDDSSKKTVTIGKMHFQIEKMKDKRIEKVKLTIESDE